MQRIFASNLSRQINTTQHSSNDPYVASAKIATTAANTDVESDLDEIDVLKISKDDIENEIILIDINPL